MFRHHSFPIFFFDNEGGSGGQGGSPGNSGSGGKGEPGGQEPLGGTPKFVIDPKFSNLPYEEAIARTHQSIITPLNQQVKDLSEKHKTYDNMFENFNKVFSDSVYADALIYELKPELLKPVDIDEETERLTKEKFGADIEIKQEELLNPFSKSSKIKRFIDTAMADLTGKYKETKNLKTFSDLRKEAKVNIDKRTADEQKLLADIRKQEKWDDEMTETFIKFGKNLSLKTIVPLFKFVMSNPELKSSIAGISSGSPTDYSAVQKKMDELFGLNKSGAATVRT